MDRRLGKRLVDAAREKCFLKGWRLQLTVPSVLARDEDFELRVTAFGPDGLPAPFEREIDLAGGLGVEGLPGSFRLDPAEGGHGVVRGLRARGEDLGAGRGWLYVQAKAEGAPYPVRSNAAWVFEEPPFRVYWGDIHVHTTHSNCHDWACHEPEFALAYARDASHLDFAAAADHLRGLASEAGRWEEQQRLVGEYDEPGRFVPLLGFESSHRKGFGGDNNAYFLGSSGPYFWLDRDDMRGNNPEVPLEELWRFLDSTGERYLTAPHHTGRSGKYRRFDEDPHDPGREPVFEVYSAWGSSERHPSRFPLQGGNTDLPCYFVDALRAGCRYGLIASSDDHTTLPGGEWKVWSGPLGPKSLGGYIHRGLAAVRAPELTREALWEALFARRCCATTFDRTLVDFRVGDSPMGSERAVAPGEAERDRRKIEAVVTTSLGKGGTVVLVRNGDEIARGRWSADGQVVGFDDDEPLERVAVAGARHHPEPFVCYYLRVEGQNGSTQWTSPVWLDVG